MKPWWIVPVLSLVPAVAAAQNDPNQPPPAEQTMPAQQVGAQPGAQPVQPGAQPAQPAPGQPVYYQQQPPPPGYGQPVYYQPQPQPYAQPVYYPAPVGRAGGYEYNGGPVPPGMHVEHHRARGLSAGGGIMFGIPYVISIIAGLYCMGNYHCAPNQGWLVAPAVGPWIAAAQYGLGSDSVAILVIDGILQAGGLAMLVLSFVRTHDVVVYGENRPRHGQHFAWTVLPSAPGAPIGATFSAVTF